MMLANLRTKTETTSEICWEKSCNWVSTRPKAGSARSSDSGANPIDEITGESSSGTNSSAPEFSISFDRNMRAASRLAWCHLITWKKR